MKPTPTRHDGGIGTPGREVIYLGAEIECEPTFTYVFFLIQKLLAPRLRFFTNM